ncbi:MAG: phage tail protein, partial [Oscillospiraceae bacterium]|nr:phage tail protein [Oscillospiraceae bacterium]
MYDFAPSSFFEVHFEGSGIGMGGEFTSVSGLGMEFEYETYNEGGRNYPRSFFKGVVPQTLVLEQGTVTTFDAFAAWVAEINLGVTRTLDGIVLLKDHTGQTMREWTIIDAMLTKYIGPSLDSSRVQLAVNRIE